MKLSRLQTGQIVYDVAKTRMGNTTLRTVSVWRVRVIAVDSEKATVTASWNGNPARTYTARAVKRWRATEPTLIRSVMGVARLARRGEKVPTVASRQERIGVSLTEE